MILQPHTNRCQSRPFLRLTPAIGLDMQLHLFAEERRAGGVERIRAHTRSHQTAPSTKNLVVYVSHCSKYTPRSLTHTPTPLFLKTEGEDDVHVHVVYPSCAVGSQAARSKHADDSATDLRQSAPVLQGCSPVDRRHIYDAGCFQFYTGSNETKRLRAPLHQRPGFLERIGSTDCTVYPYRVEPQRLHLR